MTTPAVGGELVANTELQRHLRRLIDTRGLARVSSELGIAREPLARYLAAIPVQVGTFRLIESTLTERVNRPRGGAPPLTATVGEVAARGGKRR